MPIRSAGRLRLSCGTLPEGAGIFPGRPISAHSPERRKPAAKADEGSGPRPRGDERWIFALVRSILNRPGRGWALKAARGRERAADFEGGWFGYSDLVAESRPRKLRRGIPQQRHRWRRPARF